MVWAMTHAPLLAEIERFIAATGMGESYFGRRAVNDGKLVRRLRSGRPIEVDTVVKIKVFMRLERERRERALQAISQLSEGAAA